MNITVIGRGNVGGGLAQRWRAAGHEVQEIGRDSGDASAADVIVVAVPGGEIATALATVDGVGGKVTIDATNAVRDRPADFESLAHQVKSIVGGPTAKAFNLNFANIYDEIDAQSDRPANLFAAEDDAREIAERLSRDAGYEPVYAGGLDAARALEDHLALMFAINRGGFGPFFYRIWSPRS